MHFYKIIILSLTLLLVPPSFVPAQQQGKQESDEKPSATDTRRADEILPDAFQEKQVETQHSLKIDGRVIRYTATAGTLLLKTEKDKPEAAIFFVAYTKIGNEKPQERPITFCFNGGPGSSSVWLHLGALGPRRVELKTDGVVPAPPYSLRPNEHSLIDVTDLVFIDPVSTGYSRAVRDEDAKRFHGVEEDIHSVGDFIRLYTTRKMRWLSPKFLAGESYGTVRAAGLAYYLQKRHGLYLNGLMLISPALDFQTLRFTAGNDLPYALFLPAYAATAWYHRQLSEQLQNNLQQTLQKAEQFAIETYLPALAKGTELAERERLDQVKRLAEFTGLSAEYIERANLRVSIFEFTKELLRAQRQTVGRLDSRFIGIDKDAAGQFPEYDPSYEALHGIFAANLNDYVRTELDFSLDLPYEVLAAERVHPWDYGSFENRYLYMGTELRKAMNENNHLHVFFGSGYFDLATPYFATNYTINHLNLEPEVRERVSSAYYNAGHMMYIDLKELALLKNDLTGFINKSLNQLDNK